MSAGVVLEAVALWLASQFSRFINMEKPKGEEKERIVNHTTKTR